MAWRLHIRSGEFRDAAGNLLAVAHSGHGDAMNDPARVRERNKGPIPPGRYVIGPAFTHPRCGPVSMRLVPMEGTDTFGRSGFLLHGPNRTADPTDDSEGCPVLLRNEREQVARSDDRDLVVVGDDGEPIPLARPALAPTTFQALTLTPQSERKSSMLDSIFKKFTSKNLTLFGALVFVGVLVAQAATLFDGVDATNPDVKAIWEAGVAFVIALMAKGSATTGGTNPATPEAAKRVEG